MRRNATCRAGSFLKAAIICAISMMSLAGPASADIITTRDGRQMNGIVVEEYRDRVLFSTVEGEITVMKSDIKELLFDDEETNLIRLGEQAMERRKYLTAVGYYGKALKINPDCRAARDSLILLQRYLSDQAGAVARAEMKRMDDIDRYGGSIASEEDEATELKKARELLAGSLGISLDTDGKMPIITAVRVGSPADDAGMRRGDAITAVWGRLTGYMSIGEVIDCLTVKASSEVRCTIERTINVPVNPDRTPFSGPEDIIGAVFGMEFDGLTLAKARDGGLSQKAGLKDGDLIVAIDGAPTRYMPLKKAVEIVRAARGPIAFTVRRDTIIWRTNA